MRGLPFSSMSLKILASRSLLRPLATDNWSAIAVAKNPGHPSRCMKHMNSIFHEFREFVEHGEVAPIHCSYLLLSLWTSPKYLTALEYLTCDDGIINAAIILLSLV